MASFVSYCVCTKWCCGCEFPDEVSKPKSICIQNSKCSILYMKTTKLLTFIYLNISQVKDT